MIAKNDVIKIGSKDILDAISIELYGKTYNLAQKENEEWNDSLWEQFLQLQTKGVKYNTLAFDSNRDQQNYHIQLITTLINSPRDKYFLSDQYLVDETYSDYFTIRPLNEEHAAKLKNSKEIFKLKFPYKEEHKTFAKLRCNWS